MSAGEEWRLKECGIELGDCCDNGLSVAVPKDASKSIEHGERNG